MATATTKSGLVLRLTNNLAFILRRLLLLLLHLLHPHTASLTILVIAVNPKYTLITRTTRPSVDSFSCAGGGGAAYARSVSITIRVC